MITLEMDAIVFEIQIFQNTFVIITLVGSSITKSTEKDTIKIHVTGNVEYKVNKPNPKENPDE